MQFHDPAGLATGHLEQLKHGFSRSEVGGAENFISAESVPLVLPLNCLTNEAHNCRCFVLCVLVRCMRILRHNYCPKRPRAVSIDPE